MPMPRTQSKLANVRLKTSKKQIDRRMLLKNIKGLRKTNFSPAQLQQFSKGLSLHPELALATRFAAMEKSGSLNRLKINARTKRKASVKR